MLHGCQISSSREKYSFLLKPTKPSSMFTKNSPWPMEFYQKRSNSWYNKRNDKRSWYSVQPKLQYELWTKHILNISNETIIWQRKGRNWISFEMFVVTLNPNGKKTLFKRFIWCTFLFSVLEDLLHLYLLFAEDYTDSPKIKKKKELVIYILNA